MLCILFQEKLSWHLWNNLVRSGLSLCEAFSQPPRAIIETEANRHSAGADAVFVLRRRLRKRAFDAPPYHKKIAQPKVARFASFRDSVGIRESAVFYRGIRCFTGSFGVG